MMPDLLQRTSGLLSGRRRRQGCFPAVRLFSSSQLLKLYAMDPPRLEALPAASSGSRGERLVTSTPLLYPAETQGEGLSRACRLAITIGPDATVTSEPEKLLFFGEIRSTNATQSSVCARTESLDEACAAVNEQLEERLAGGWIAERNVVVQPLRAVDLIRQLNDRL